MPNIEVVNKLVFVEDRPTVLIPLIKDAIHTGGVPAEQIEVLYYWWDSDEREKYTEAFHKELESVTLTLVDGTNIWDHLLPASRGGATIILDYSLRRMRPEYIVPTFITQVKKDDKENKKNNLDNIYVYSVWGDFQDSVIDAARKNALQVRRGPWDDVAGSYSIESFDSSQDGQKTPATIKKVVNRADPN